MPQSQDEVPQVDAVEGAVNEGREPLQVLDGGVHHEVVRRFIHHVHQLPCVGDDGLALTPRDGRREEADGLRILPIGEGLGYLDRVVRDERRAGKAFIRFVEQVLQFLLRVP
jgi:hypothetical protein